jgi:hypothetical protein
MTTQPELDLAHGLPSLTPKVESQPSYSKSGRIEVEVHPSLNNPKASCSVQSMSLSSDFKQRSDYYRRASTHLHIWVKHKDAKKNSVIAQYASRHLDSQDGRMAEYRKQFSAVVKHLHANRLLAFEPTLDQLENPTGFRWNQKAGCSCGCSPAFVAPVWLKLASVDGYRLNTIYCNVEEKDDSEVALAINPARFDSLVKDPTMPWASEQSKPLNPKEEGNS